MNSVRIGVVGVGGMGGVHVKTLVEKVEGGSVTAVCDLSSETAEKVAAETSAKIFTDYAAFLASGEFEAILVATPHKYHPDQVIAAFEAGKHVLCEKPVAVEVREADRMNAAYEKVADRLTYAAMFQYRTRGVYRRMHELLAGGEMGAVRRVVWVCTDWYRTQAYYDSGTWRGTWAGEGGGVLLNQMPHNLDVLTWLTGSPAKVMAKVHIGKDHAIEVEDEINAILTYPNGATGVLVSTTGDFPGTDWMEITCDRGTLRVTDKQLTGVKLDQPLSEATGGIEDMWGKPDSEPLEADACDSDGGHADILQNWVDVIRGRADALIAPGIEGIKGLELGNAILYSGLKGGREVDLPLDRDGFHALLTDLIDKAAS